MAWMPGCAGTPDQIRAVSLHSAKQRTFSARAKTSGMQRRPNTDVSGKPFNEEVVDAVWEKARAMGTSAILRVDAWGWTIVRQDYGNARSRYGWEIDHVIPVAQGGTDDLTNLQPLQWENNRRKDELQGITGISGATETHTVPKANSHTPTRPSQHGPQGTSRKRHH